MGARVTLIAALALMIPRPASAAVISFELTAAGPTIVAPGEPFTFFAALTYLTEIASSTEFFRFEPDPILFGEQTWVTGERITTQRALGDVRFRLDLAGSGFLGTTTVDLLPTGIVPLPPVPLTSQTAATSRSLTQSEPGLREINLTTTLNGFEWVETTTFFSTRFCDGWSCSSWGPIDQHTTSTLSTWTETLAAPTLMFEVIDPGQVQPVPEPSRLVLWGLTLLVLIRSRRLVA